MNKNTALALGIPSAFVIIGGIILSIVLYLLTSNIVEGINDAQRQLDSPNQTDKYLTNWFGNDKPSQLHDSPQSAHHRSERSSDRKSSSLSSAGDYPMWICGLVYIFPGLLGLLSAIFQKRGLYITSIIFSVIVLLIMAAATLASTFLLFFTALTFSAISDNCYDKDGACRCTSSTGYGGETTYDMFKSCSYFKTIFSLFMSIMFFLVFTWVALMVMFIMCCYYTCCAKNQGSSGVILSPAQQPMISSNQGDAYNQQYFDDKVPSKV